LTATQKKIVFKLDSYSCRAGEELLLDYGAKYWQGREELELP
jgi:hypothetical protein